MTRDRDTRQDQRQDAPGQDRQDPGRRDRDGRGRRGPQGFTSQARPAPGRDPSGPPPAAPRPAGSTEPDERLHNMGGTGPASIRGSGVRPGGQRGQDAEPHGGYARPMGYVAGRDDDWSETAGSDEKAVAARTDEVEGDEDTFGPSPQRVPETADQGRDGDPGFRVRGPLEPGRAGEVEEDPGADEPATDGESALAADGQGEHVTGGLDWVPDDGDDPDGGSGRTDAGDGGYLPGEATGRPYRG